MKNTTIHNNRLVYYYCLIVVWVALILSGYGCTKHYYTATAQLPLPKQNADIAAKLANKMQKTQPTAATTTTSSSSNFLDNWALYAPDTQRLWLTPPRLVRVNVHLVNNTDSTKNFTQQTGREFVKRLIFYVNYRWSKNTKMNLPEGGNKTPVLPILIQFELAGQTNQAKNEEGIYFHANDSLYWFNKKDKSLYSKTLFETYGVNKDSVLNIFLIEHHPDSIKSRTYKASNDGIGYINHVKLANSYHAYLKLLNANDPNALENTAAEASSLLCHELGHSLGLWHTWNTNDGCDDTPQHTQCWNWDVCPDHAPSNNYMDYTALREALTPCQLGRMHANFTNPNSPQRKYTQPNWCNQNPNETVTIYAGDTLRLNRFVDMPRDIVIAKNGCLILQNAHLNMPPNSKILVQPGGTLLLYGSTITCLCPNQTWRGIEVKNGIFKKAKLRILKPATLKNIANRPRSK